VWTAPSPHDPPDLSSQFAPLRGTAANDLLTVRIAFSGDIYVVAVYGELDMSTEPKLRRELLHAEASGASEIVLDLSALHFIDSSGIKLLCDAHTRSQLDGGRLRLLRGPRQVHRVVELCGLDDDLPFLD
jgi:anti-sigma B factor antagonist